MKDHILAFIDLETTGLNSWKHEIIEIGVVLARQTGDPIRPLEKVEEFDIQVRPEHIEDADETGLKVSKYKTRIWDRVVSRKEAVEILERKIAGCVMVGQNVAFDFSFLYAAFVAEGKNFDDVIHYHKLDTASIAIGHAYWEKRLTRFSLRELTEYTGVKNENAHTALSDARATFEVAQVLLTRPPQKEDIS